MSHSHSPEKPRAHTEICLLSLSLSLLSVSLFFSFRDKNGTKKKDLFSLSTRYEQEKRERESKKEIYIPRLVFALLCIDKLPDRLLCIFPLFRRRKKYLLDRVYKIAFWLFIYQKETEARFCLILCKIIAFLLIKKKKKSFNGFLHDLVFERYPSFLC